MKTIFPFILILSLVFVSCEGVRTSPGTVQSAETGLPIENAEIVVLNDVGESTTTDSVGNFMLSTGFTSMMFGGPKFKFEVRKPGYQSQRFETRVMEEPIKLILE